MTTDNFKRKLTAILSADVAGYSRLMGENEESTVRTLNKFKELIFNLVFKNNGRVIDSPGDNVLAEFASVVDAVKCAVQIQKDLKEQNEELPSGRKMEFRIGINIGDVIHDGDRIYGDGVNVAARIESLAEPGGICISTNVYDQVKSKLDLEYEYLGEHSVKNIAEPVRVYRIFTDFGATGKIVREKRPVSSSSRKTVVATIISIIIIVAGLFIWRYYQNQSIKTEHESGETEQTVINSGVTELPKTIAILPFDNLSPDPDQEYFSSGLAAELISMLKQVEDLTIIDKDSSFRLKEKNVDDRTIGETLDVSYLLKGSVRKAQNKIRIDAQLIRARDGYLLFSKPYDGELKDTLTLQNKIAKAVTTALSVTLGVGDFNRPGMTHNVEAYDLYLRAIDNYSKYTPDSTLTAIDQFKQALDVDSSFGLCWLSLGNAYTSSIPILPPGQSVDFKKKAAEALKSAEAIVPDMPELLKMKAQLLQSNGSWTKAENIWKQILDNQGHSDPEVNNYYGQMLLCVGRSSDALIYLQRAKRLNPLSNGSYYLSVALFYTNRIEEALAEAKYGQTQENRNWLYIITEWSAALESNDRKRAAALVDSNFKLGGDYPDATILRLGKLLLMEDTEAALSELKEISKEADISINARLFLADVAIIQGDVELTFEMYQGLPSFLVYNIWIPRNSAVRQLPAFKKYVRDIGLYDYWRESDEWPDLCHPVSDDDFVCD